jgi:hypothetical protein
LTIFSKCDIVFFIFGDTMKKCLILLSLSFLFNIAYAEKAITTVYDKNNNIVLEIKESELKNYKQMSFSSKTPWYPEIKKFDGISFRDVLEKAKIKENSKLQIVAWNNFEVEVPAEDGYKYKTILTTHINGKRITLRDKGPLFLMYPLDDNPILNTGMYFNRSAWQIKEIHEK